MAQPTKKLENMSASELIARVKAMQSEGLLSASDLSSLKEVTKSVSTPRKSEYDPIRAALETVKTAVSEAVSTNVKRNDAIGVTFIVDNWNGNLVTTIEISSVAGEAPKGNCFKSADGMFYTSRQAFLRLHAKSAVTRTYAASQCADLVKVPLTDAKGAVNLELVPPKSDIPLKK